MTNSDNHNDDELFKSFTTGVHPINQDTHKPHKPKLKPNKIKQPIDKKHDYQKYDINIELMNQNHWIDSEEIASYKTPGLQPKTFLKLKTGKLNIEAQLDLHHLTATNAMREVDHFLDSCMEHSIRSVLIIHGKGHMSTHDKPILKNIVIEHLQNNSFVLAYHSAQSRHGGAGAMYVLLKENTRS